MFLISKPKINWPDLSPNPTGSPLTITSQKDFAVEMVKREGVTWKSRKGGGAHLKTLFSTHSLGSCFGVAVQTFRIPRAEPGANSFTLEGAGFIHGFEIQGEAVWV